MASKTQKTCIIFRRYLVKFTGTICCIVRNEAGVEYTTCVHTQGYTSCSCLAGQNGQNCYHVDHVLSVEQARLAYAEALMLLSKVITAPLIIERTPEKHAAAQAAFAAADRIKPRVFHSGSIIITIQGAKSMNDLPHVSTLPDKPLQDDEPTAQPSVSMTLEQARVARRIRGTAAAIPAEHLKILLEEEKIIKSRVSVEHRIEAAPLTRNAGFSLMRV